MSITTRVLLSFVIVIQCFAGDWPDWRGPNRDGISTETGWLAPWPDNGPPVLWRKNLGAGYTSVTIVGDRLFTMGNHRINGRETDFVYCLNPGTGEELWKHSYPCRRGHFQGTRMVPIPDGDRVYSLSREGNLFCLSVEDGSVIWSKDLHREYGLKSHRHGMSCHPLVVDEKLILEIGGNGASVIALDKKSGKEIWRSGGEKLGYSSPILYQENGLRRMAMFTGSALMGMIPETGEILWKTPWEPEYQVSVATPIFKGNRVFVSSGYGPGCAVYEFNDRNVQRIWHSEVIVNHYNACVRVGDHLYGFDGGYKSRARTQFLKCIEFDTGKELWKESGMGKGALMVAENKLIIFSEFGKLIIAEVSPQGFKELQSVQLLDRKSWTMPVLSNGRIYCRNENGDMVCVGVNEEYVKAAPKLVTRTHNEVSLPANPGSTSQVSAPLEPVQLSNIWPGSDKDLLFAWSDAEDKKNSELLTSTGGNKFGKRAIELVGGRTLVNGLNRKLLDACRQTNQLTVEAVIQTNDLAQVGPARIVSFSYDPYKRNFTIGQNKNELGLRLRTTSTGENGLKPEVKLCRIQQGKPTHVIVSYRPGELTCYVNGKSVQVKQIDGDFSNWEEHQLLFGNESKDERAWRGQLHHIAINNRFISSKEAFARFLLTQDLELPEDLKTTKPKASVTPEVEEVKPPADIVSPKPVPVTSEKTAHVQTTQIETSITSWLVPSCSLRAALRVSNASDKEVLTASVELEALFKQSGARGEFAPESVRVIDVTDSKSVQRVPYQLVRHEDGADELLLWLGHPSATATRDFHIYADNNEAGLYLPAQTPQVSIETNLKHQDEDVIRIATPTATYYYSTKGGSFSSMIDRDGRDWIGYRPTGGSAGSHRGIPNLPYPEGYFHPGGKDCTTTVLNRGPLRASLHSESKDGKWACRWDIYPTFAELTVLKGNHPYWFLYEGTPGGKLADEDVCIRSTGDTASIYQSWKGDLPGAEWVCFVDKNLGRGLFLANHQQDDAIDSYWPMQRNMTVFGFGRDGLKSFMNVFPAKFTLRLTEAVTFKSLASYMASVTSTSTTEVSAMKPRP